MCKDNCELYWNLADYFPVNDALHYWCDGSPGCVEAKKNALLSALDRGDVKYRRRDGKSFNDSVYELEAKNQLLVERESFITWAKSVSDDVEKQSLQNNIPINRRAETSLLTIIGAMVGLMQRESPNGQPYSILKNQSAIVDQLVAHYGDKPGISTRTLEGKLAAAKRELLGS